MARRRGSIQQRGPDRWLVRLYLGMENGKRKYVSKTVRGKWSDANAMLSQLLREVDSGAFYKPSDVTVEEFLERWLETKTRVVRESTLTEYRTRLRMDVYPNIGDKRLRSLTPADIEGVYAALRKGPRNLSHRTIYATHVILRQALRYAAHNLLVPRDLLDRIAAPEVPQPAPIRPLTVADTRALFEWANENQPKYYAFWVLLITTGCRPGEALALMWDSVNLEDGWIYIQRALSVGKHGKRRIKMSPNRRGCRRRVSLSANALQLLRDLREAQLDAVRKWRIRHDFVFCNRAGKPWGISRVQKAWTVACRRAGVPDVRLYDTRHTHACHLLEHGVHPRLVAERLGYRSIKQVMDIYAHIVPSMQQWVLDTVEARLFATAPRRVPLVSEGS